jgi:hypothetical protein
MIELPHRPRRRGGLRVGLFPRFVPVSRAAVVLAAVGKSDAECILGSPDHTTRATIAQRSPQSERIRNGARPHPRKICAAIGKIAHDARPLQMPVRIVDRCRQVPFDPEIPASVASHSRVRMSGHLSSVRVPKSSASVGMAPFFCVCAEALFRLNLRRGIAESGQPATRRARGAK